MMMLGILQPHDEYGYLAYILDITSQISDKKSLRSAFCDHIYLRHPSPKKIQNTSGESSLAEDHLDLLEDQVAGHQVTSTNMLWGRSVLRFENGPATNHHQPQPAVAPVF